MIGSLLDIVQGDGGYVAGQVQSSGNYYFDNFGEAVIYALIGFLVVFVGIVIIIAIIWLVGLLMRKTNNLAFITERKKANKAKDDRKEALSSVGNAQPAENSDVPDEIMAAIVAAIMAYYQEKEEKCQFKVKRIKRL